jgi:ADP-ribose pyrophosphatase
MRERDPDDTEHDLVIHTKSLEEFERMMLDGTIRDGCTVAAWGMYSSWLKTKSH